MLRDVVVHLHNEQPILADLVAEPTASDTCLICTNLRTMNGKTPIFAERGDSTFVFPLAHIRFVEIRPASVEEGDVAAPPQVVAEQPRAGRSGKSGKQAAPEDDTAAYAVSPLQRLAWVSGDAGAPPSEPASEASEEPEPDDGELLRRVREV
jgi:hypothetical protein